MARNQRQQREASEFEERVVFINRVAKTVKGGRRMSLQAFVVVAPASPPRSPRPSPRPLSTPRSTCSTCR